jgi:hypothetical protein
MAFSADELARLGAGQIDYQYQVFVGGPRDSVAMQDIDEGAAFTAFPATTLNGALTNTATTITVVSTTGFDSAGYLLIAADATNPAEPVRYTGKTGTTFTGLTRNEPVAHVTGAAVSKWVDVTARVRGLTFRETLQGERGTWQAELRGVDYDSRLLAQNNSVLVMVRWFPTSAGKYWSGWEVFFQGYLGAGNVSDDYQEGAEWTKPVRGIDFYLENADAPARRYGRGNLALGGSTSASTAWTDASTIGHSGEVFGSPALGSDNLVDDSVSTVYCSADIPALTGGPGNYPYQWASITEVGLGPVGSGDDGAYFVLWNGRDAGWPIRFDGFANRQASYTGLEVDAPPAVSIYTKDNEQLPEIPDNERVIFCRNREIFERWAGPQQVEIVEWRSLPGAATFVLRAAGDYLEMYSNFGNPSGPARQFDWGDESGGSPPALNYGEAYYLANWTTWTLTDSPTPGRNRQADTQVYASVEIAEFAITLAGNISDSAETITFSPSTTGLNQAGGRMQIDSEMIDYAAATTYTATGCIRGVNGTTAASHTTGAVVWAVDGTNLAHKTEMIGRIGWKRRRVLDGETLVVPEDFHIWTSRDAAPTYPSADPSVTAWQTGWTKQQTVMDNAGVEWSTPDVWEATLARHVMIVCERMSNGGRFLLNEIYALRAAGYDPASTVAETGGDVATQMLEDFGLHADLIDVEDFGPVGTHLVTSKGRYMARLQELARMMGGLVIVTRDNRVRFVRSPWHPIAALPESMVTLTRSYGRVVRLEEGKRNVVAQVVLKANNPETGETFTVEYPPTPRALGNTVEMERTFYGSENEARYLAQMIYRQANSENGVSLVLAGHGDGFRVGQRVALTWDMDRAGDLYSGRNFIVTGVSVAMEHPANGPKVCDWSVGLQEYIF